MPPKSWKCPKCTWTHVGAHSSCHWCPDPDEWPKAQRQPREQSQRGASGQRGRPASQQPRVRGQWVDYSTLTTGPTPSAPPAVPRSYLEAATAPPRIVPVAPPSLDCNAASFDIASAPDEAQNVDGAARAKADLNYDIQYHSSQLTALKKQKPILRRDAFIAEHEIALAKARQELAQLKSIPDQLATLKKQLQRAEYKATQFTDANDILREEIATATASIADNDEKWYAANDEIKVFRCRISSLEEVPAPAAQPDIGLLEAALVSAVQSWGITMPAGADVAIAALLSNFTRQACFAQHPAAAPVTPAGARTTMCPTTVEDEDDPLDLDDDDDVLMPHVAPPLAVAGKRKIQTQAHVSIDSDEEPACEEAASSSRATTPGASQPFALALPKKGKTETAAEMLFRVAQPNLATG
jgi:hypothetical protein